MEGANRYSLALPLVTQISRSVGISNGARAVAVPVRKNPAIVVPCHRVRRDGLGV